MGESYGGVYVPTLAERIIVGQKDFPINLEGIALGNGWVHEKLNIDTSIRYAYGHGIVDEETWNTLQRDCCGGCIDTCDLTQEQYKDMSPFIRKIAAANVRVLLYYGDTDMVCNFMMGQKFANQLGLKRTLGKTPWKFDRRIAGFKTLFEGLTFITVRGAGHEAPRMRAPQMYYVIQQFLLNQSI
nr:Peptidase S10 domain containing protein [Haemonchus contortus]